MIYNLSTILLHAMKKSSQKPITIFQNKINKINKINNPNNFSINIDLENIKSMEIYNKYNSKPKFSILSENKKQNINKTDIIKTHIKKYRLCIIGFFCIFLASFSHSPSFHHFFE